MIRWLSLATLLFFASTLRAAEHPEHPTGPAKTPDAKHEHPAGGGKKAQEPSVGSKAWKAMVRKEYNAAVEDYVRAQSAGKAGLPAQDDKLGKQWDLKLINVHKDKIVHLGDDKFFACADLKTVEKGKKDKVDLDFYATKTPDGWKMDKVVIHKVNGKPRFTYNEKNEMVPAAD